MAIIRTHRASVHAAKGGTESGGQRLTPGANLHLFDVANRPDEGSEMQEIFGSHARRFPEDVAGEIRFRPICKLAVITDDKNQEWVLALKGNGKSAALVRVGAEDNPSKQAHSRIEISVETGQLRVDKPFDYERVDGIQGGPEIVVQSVAFERCYMVNEAAASKNFATGYLALEAAYKTVAALSRGKLPSPKRSIPGLTDLSPVQLKKQADVATTLIFGAMREMPMSDGIDFDSISDAVTRIENRLGDGAIAALYGMSLAEALSSDRTTAIDDLPIAPYFVRSVEYLDSAIQATPKGSPLLDATALGAVMAGRAYMGTTTQTSIDSDWHEIVRHLEINEAQGHLLVNGLARASRLGTDAVAAESAGVLAMAMRSSLPDVGRSRTHTMEPGWQAGLPKGSRIPISELGPLNPARPETAWPKRLESAALKFTQQRMIAFDIQGPEDFDGGSLALPSSGPRFDPSGSHGHRRQSPPHTPLAPNKKQPDKKQAHTNPATPATNSAHRVLSALPRRAGTGPATPPKHQAATTQGVAPHPPTPEPVPDKGPSRQSAPIQKLALMAPGREDPSALNPSALNSTNVPRPPEVIPPTGHQAGLTPPLEPEVAKSPAAPKTIGEAPKSATQAPGITR